MPRTDDDTWNLATSVGATATMVAAARAIATKADNPLIEDRFAEPLVRAVGVDFFTRWAAGEVVAADVDYDESAGSSGTCPMRWPPGPVSSTHSFATRHRPESVRP